MVYLSRIYTKSGDQGQTSLGDGQRVPKTNARIIAFGTVDELNSVMGIAVAVGKLSEKTLQKLIHIQNDLFDVGADLCVPESDKPLEYTPLRASEAQVTQLEHWIDEAVDQLKPLTSFILPGGTPGAAFLHQARTVCRRAEIEVLKLTETQQINSQAVIYLNRLSDLLFVLARLENNGGQDDILWTPGANRDSKASNS